MTALMWDREDDEYAEYWEDMLARKAYPCPSCGSLIRKEEIVCEECWKEEG